MTNVSNVLVRVRDLRKSYGSILALDGISFEVSRGDVLAFLGPNGAGKTTAMKPWSNRSAPDGMTHSDSHGSLRREAVRVAPRSWRTFNETAADS